MDLKLFFQAIIKFILGVLVIGLSVFIIHVAKEKIYDRIKR